MISLSRWYKLRRHRLGIGVHSPYAYRLVRDVIYGKGLYYTAYKQYLLTKGFPKRLKRLYRVIFRLIARHKLDGIRLSNSVEPQVELLVRMAAMKPIMGRGMGGWNEGKKILTICDAIDLRSGVPADMLRSGNMAVVRDLQYVPGIKDELMKAMKGGWLFADKRVAIAVSNDNEPLNLIDVKIT